MEYYKRRELQTYGGPGGDQETGQPNERTDGRTDGRTDERQKERKKERKKENERKKRTATERSSAAHAIVGRTPVDGCSMLITP